jgi:hypothetical protein
MDSIETLHAGSEPLRNDKHERFARMRALDMPLLPSAREAGYELMTAGNAAKLHRNPEIRARIAWLTRQEEEVLREKRRMLEERQWLIHDADIGDFYEIVEEVIEDEHGNPVGDAAGKPMMRRFQRLKLFDQMSRELRMCIESLSYTEKGKPNLKLYSKAKANEELRKMAGIDRPAKLALTDAAGNDAPITDADRMRALAAIIARAQAEIAAEDAAAANCGAEADDAGMQNLPLTVQAAEPETPLAAARRALAGPGGARRGRA